MNNDENLKIVSSDVYIRGAKENIRAEHWDVMQILRPGCTWQADVTSNGLSFRDFSDPNGLSAPSSEEVEKELQYQKEFKKYYQYAYDRCNEYPDGFDQFDMLWHSINNGENLKDSEWFKVIKEIKDKYPKPNFKKPER